MILTSMASRRPFTLPVCFPPKERSSNSLTSYLAEGSGAGNWQAAYQKARAFVGKLTAEEKINLTAGTSVSNGCSGNIAPIARLDFPGFCVSDAGNGLVSSNRQ
jgi:hypothetical protein